MQDPAQLKQKRLTAILLGTGVIVCLVFLMYSFVQKAAADKAREEAIANEHRALEMEKRFMEQQHKLREIIAEKDSIITALTAKMK